MGLYLCVFNGDEDVDGVDLGPYEDYNVFREYVVRELEGGKAGSKYPTLICHSDCDGEWSSTNCEKLRSELAEIAVALKSRPAISFTSDWQIELARSIGLVPQTALDSFIDVDGEPLVERLQTLVDTALRKRQPILFQ